MSLRTKEIRVRSNSTNKTGAVASVIIPFAILSFILIVFGMKYDTNDDATIANLMAGAYGDTFFTVHINIILTALLKPLYYIFPNINWYIVFQQFFTCMGISAVLYSFVKRLGTGKGLLLGCAVLIPFAVDIMYSFQYSKSSCVMLAGGLMLITENLDRFNKFTFMGIILSVFGSMTRWESFFAVGGIYRAILLVRFFSFDKKGKKNAVITMAIFFTVIFGAEAVDVVIYNLNPGWKEYVAYNAARTEYSDYKVYLLNGENIFKRDGIDDNEFALLYNWDFYDEGNFSTRLLEKLCEKVPGKSLLQTVKDTAYTFIHLLYDSCFNLAFLAVLIWGFLSFKKDYRYAGFAGTLIVFGFLLTFLMYRGRFTRWVKPGLLWALTVVLILTLLECGSRFINKKYFVVSLFALMCFISIPHYRQVKGEADYYKATRIENNNTFDRISRDKDNLYLMTVETLDALAGYDPAHPRSKDYFSNIVALGGWLSRTPNRNRALEKYGVKRPVVDAVDNPRVFIDTVNIHILTEYASNQLGKPVYAIKNGIYEQAPYQLVTCQDFKQP